MYSILINRFASDKDKEGNLKQTRGLLYVLKDDKIVFHCWVLERPWLKNLRNVSCIPVGEYEYTMLNRTPSFNYSVLYLKDVPDRSEILVHSGNEYKDSKGCPLVGEEFAYLNSDKYLDLTNSRKTMARLAEVLTEHGLEDGKIKVISSVPNEPMTIPN